LKNAISDPGAEKRPGYPFTAMVGQESLKTALLLNLIDPALGGVLIRGERGTGKSTLVRSLARLASRPGPDACAPASMQVVELPLNATEERLVGGMDLERALKDGERVFQPGIFSAAHGQILYVDEINLLDDHLVDLLLDVSAMGVNHVEREGLSHSHPSRFILIGTMNPEEGELRPQLLDRFGLSVSVSGERETERRVEVLRRRMAYEADAAGFLHRFDAEEESLFRHIREARERLSRVRPGEGFLESAAGLALHMACPGHRADIALVRTSLALAAWESRPAPDREHLARAAELVFPHRLPGAAFTEVTRETGPLKAWLERAK
jgi:magnesium chelatase subunit I